jgi:hypothetical protein
VFVLGEKDRLNNRLFPAWEFQDPKMEVLYHIRPYFGGRSSYIGLTLYIVGTSILGS